MTEPRRLLDDPEVDAALREALRREAAAPAPPLDVPAALARFRQAAGAPGVPSAPAAGAAKAVWLAAGGAALGAAVWLVASRGASPAAPPLSAPPPSGVGDAALAATAADRAAPPASALAREPGTDAAPSPREAAASSAPTPLTAAPPVASDRAARLAEEVRQLAELRRLATSDPAAAVRAADEGHARFRGGQLYPEREAVAILALARAGRVAEARPRAARFLQAFPRSPLADPVRRAAGIAP
ncbi:MAG: hypothetical protein IT376_12100 [Polyangiaceae bacterium]|nr:hypothetical protein [Polyangiaceae bacterium]